MDHHVTNPRDRPSDFKTMAMPPNNAFTQDAVQLGNSSVSSSYAQFFESNNWLSSSNSPMGTPGALQSPSLSSMQNPAALQSWHQVHSQNNNGSQYQNVSHDAGIAQPYYSNPSENPSHSQYSHSQFSQLPHLGAGGQSQSKPASPVPTSIVGAQSLAPKPTNFSSYSHPIQQKSATHTSFQQHTAPFHTPAPSTHQIQTHVPRYHDIVNYQTGVFPSASPKLSSNPLPTTHVAFAPPAIKYETSQNRPPTPVVLKSNPNFMVISAEDLSRVTNSRIINHGIALSNELLELPYPKVAQLPRYEPRRNLRDLRHLAENDADLKLKLEKLDRKTRSKLMSGSPAATQSSGSILSKPPSSSSSESDSSDGSDSSDELEIEEKPPLPPSRPTDPVKGAEYDMIKAVWHSRSSYIPDDVLLARVGQFSELFFKLRDRWKGSREALTKATEQKQSDQPSLKSTVKRNRSIVESALSAAVQHGHPHILEMLSTNKRLLAGLYTTLLAQIQDKDFSGSLTVTTLKFLAKLTRVVNDSLDQTKLSKAISVITKKGSDEVKTLVKNILDRAANNSQKAGNYLGSPLSKTAVASKLNSPLTDGEAKLIASPNSKAGEPSKIATKLADAKAKSENATETESILKRPRLADGSVSQSTKRQAQTTSTAGIVKRPLTTVGSKSSAAPTASLNTAARTKQISGSAKSSSPASTASSVAKKGVNSTTGPPTSLATRGAPSLSSASSSFSFGGMMEGILNPKQLEANKKVEVVKPKETVEQATKRIRKEARRKLRVSWKPDHELVSVRLFTHDPDEETGHDASSMRDVGDIETEGRMFKQLHKDHKEIVDVEMEEEEKEEIFTESPYPVPTAVDFSVVEDVERERNYSRFGGGKLEPDSKDRQKQEEREAGTLMAIYITRADIPPRPHSPVEPYSGEIISALNFGNPSEEVRQRERALKPAASNTSSASSNTSNAPNIQDILRVLAPSAQAPAQPATPPQQLPPTQPSIATQPSPDLFASLQQFSTQISGQPQPTASTMPQPNYSSAIQSSDPLSNPLLSGLFGGASYAPPPAAAAPTPAPASNDITAILAQLQGLHQPVHPLQPVPPVSQPAAQTPNVADILAHLGLAQQQPSLAYNGYSLPQQPQQESSQFNGPYENPDRKRAREMTDDGNNENLWNKRPNNADPGAERGAGGNFKKWDSTQRKPKWSFDDNPKKFSQPCKFWPDRCTKGAKCTYRHDT